MTVVIQISRSNNWISKDSSSPDSRERRRNRGERLIREVLHSLQWTTGVERCGAVLYLGSRRELYLHTQTHRERPKANPRLASPLSTIVFHRRRRHRTNAPTDRAKIWAAGTRHREYNGGTEEGDKRRI